jgi:serine/threonine protein kinase
MHRMHRNIKPSNILLNSRGEAKITDLGQSKKLQHTLDACNTLVASQVSNNNNNVNNLIIINNDNNDNNSNNNGNNNNNSKG